MRPPSLRLCASYRFRSACLLLLGFLLGLPALGLAPVTSLAQPAPPAGDYRIVDTWDPADLDLPQRLWKQPAGLALSAAGELFVSDAALRRVEVLAADGSPLRQIGRGGGPDDLVHPEHLALDEARDRLYVCDPGASRLAIYRLDGSLEGHWTGFGGLGGVAVAADGRVVVSDAGQDRLRVFAPDGSEVGGWGESGSEPQQLSRPGAVDIAADGHLWVVDRGNERLVRAGLDGPPDAWLKLDDDRIAGSEILDLAVDGDALWLGTQVGLARLESGRGQVRGLLEGAVVAGIALSPERGMWAAVRPFEGKPGIWRYRFNQSSGDPIERWAGDGLVAGYLDGVETLDIGADGQATILDVPARIQRLALDGRPRQQIESPDPEEATSAADGRVFAAAGDEILAYRPDGSPDWQTRLRATQAGRDSQVVGLAWDASSDEVLALEATTKSIYRLSAAGEILESGPLRVQDASNASWTDLAVAADGRMIALDAGHQRLMGWDADARPVLDLELPAASDRFALAADDSFYLLGRDGWGRKLAPDGQLLAEWDLRRLGLGRDSRPVDIAVDAADRVYVADGAADLVTVFEWDPDAEPQRAPEVAEGCEVLGDKRAVPSELLLGERVTIELLLTGACAPSAEMLDVAIVIGPGFEGGLLRSTQAALEDLVDSMDPAAVHLAIPDRLSGDLQYLRRRIRRLDPSEPADAYANAAAVATALEVAEDELWSPRGRSGARKVVVAMVTGEFPYQTWNVSQQAGQIDRRGGEVFALGAGRLQNRRILEEMASSREHIFEARAIWSISGILSDLFQSAAPSLLFRSLVLTDVLPENMEYVPGSARPPASLQGDRLIWHLDEVPKLGTGVRFDVIPQAVGTWPTNVEAVGEYRDARDQEGRYVFPVPTVLVRAAPTPTIIPSSTPEPSRTPTATSVPASPSPSATDGPPPEPLFLPIALREHCDPRKRAVDIALLLDASLSMGAPADEAGASSKLEAAASATRQLLDRLEWQVDQAGVLSFNAEARLLAPLGSSRQAIDEALGRIELASGTEIDRGLREARAELGSERRRQGSRRALVLLTDGQAEPEARERALSEAALAREAGIVVFTIGLGGDVDAAALEAIAGYPERYFEAPTAAELGRIYEAIVDLIPCGS